MNKTININLSGFVFNIEEEAYERLKQYLDNVGTQFSNAEEREEIMSDIELRIAEIFQDKIGPFKEVIIMTDIDEIIDILGHPEDYNEGDESIDETENQNQESNNNERRKRLFRDTDNAVLGGVCAGLGHYFDVDKTIIRILFVLLFVFFGSGILLYLILLFIVPEAKTTTEKIEMKGDFVNVESIKQHFEKIKQNLTNGEKQKQFRSTIKSTVDRGTAAGKNFFEIIAKIFGIGLTLGGIFLFAMTLFTLFGNNEILLPFIGEDRIPDLQTMLHIIYPGDSPSTLFFVCLLIVIFIPIITLILTGLRLLFDYRHAIKPFVIGLTTTWFIAAGILFFYSLELASDFKSNQKIIERIEDPILANDTLYVDVAHDDQFSDLIDPYNHWNSAELIKTDGQYIYMGWSELSFRTTADSGDFSVNITKHSCGASIASAIERIERINYPIQVKNGILFIPPYMRIPAEDKIRAQYASVEIVIPENKTIIFGSNIGRIYRHAEYGPEPHGSMSPGSVWVNETGVLEKNVQ